VKLCASESANRLRLNGHSERALQVLRELQFREGAIGAVAYAAVQPTAGPHAELT